jgi:hypothetical protein
MSVLDVPQAHRVWVAAAFLLGAMARDTLGDPDAAVRALQRALDLAQPDELPSPFSSARCRACPTARPGTTRL